MKARRNGMLALAVGAFVSFDRRICAYLDALRRCLAGRMELMVVNTAAPRHWLPDVDMRAPAITVPPKVQDVFPKNIDRRPSGDQRRCLGEYPFLRVAAARLRGAFPYLNQSSAEYYAYIFYKYACQLISRYQPNVLMLWNQFVPFHYILAQVGAGFVKTIYMEYGVLPGSFSFDPLGQVGESLPAVEADYFNGLAVDEAAVDLMADHLEHLWNSGRNHKPLQRESAADQLAGRLKKNRPVIFLAGQSDMEAGLVPYTESVRRWHSPLFSSSADALLALDRLADVNDWNLVYKPHPIALRRGSEPLDGRLKRALVIEQANLNELIDMADLVVTIVSQCSYIASIRRRPVLLMGYNMLTRSGAAYTALSREGLEPGLAAALDGGLTADKKRAFVRHAARLGRYYLYDDAGGVSTPYVKSVDDLARLVIDLAEGKERDRAELF